MFRTLQFVSSLMVVNLVNAQHCAPICESYFSVIKVGHNEESLRVELNYTKTGGRLKAKYQLYLFAFFERNKEAIFFSLPENIFNDSIATVLNTDVVELNEGDYRYQKSFQMDDLVSQLLKTTHGDSTVSGADGFFPDNFSMGVFIPFLESSYSNNKYLPTDKHECNYDGRSFLLFQPLPYSFRIKFGSRLGHKIKKYFVDINAKG
jgi:hypothetical protein